jgi:heme-degrading monooxygenase HmoA
LYARTTFIHVEPHKEDEAIQLFNNSVVPAAKQQQGFKGVLQLIDRDSGRGIWISLWETEADLLASETNNFYQEQLTKFRFLLAATPTRHVYEVTSRG